MLGIVLAIIVLAAYALGSRYCSRYLAEKVYALDESVVTPAPRPQEPGRI
jgi:carbon starvation protein CstA